MTTTRTDECTTATKSNSIKSSTSVEYMDHYNDDLNNVFEGGIDDMSAAILNDNILLQ